MLALPTEEEAVTGSLQADGPCQPEFKRDDER